MPNEEPSTFNEDLLKNLEEDLGKFGSDSHKLIQDFVPYNESTIWDFSDSYYKSKGIMAWSNKVSKIIPHKIGTNYQSAIAFAKLVKVNLEKFPSDERIQVLEAGAGSARFSRHFLLALKELGIQDRVQLIISDYSSCNLDSINSAGILEGFTEDEDYMFQCVDITKAEDLAGLKPRAIFMHYVLDALPLTIIRKNEKIEELLISSSIRKEQELDVLQNEFLQSRIEHEDKWQTYNPDSELEKKYWEFFSNYHSDSFNRELYYSYTALDAVSKLVDSLDENGFLLNIDILPGNERRYIVVGNSIAHEVDNDLLASFMEASSNKAFVKDDRSISRLVIAKNQTSLTALNTKFEEVFGKGNLVREYIELEKEIETAIEASQSSQVETKLNRLTELAPHYAFTYELWSCYYSLTGDDIKASEYRNKAQAIDYWDDL